MKVQDIKITSDEALQVAYIELRKLHGRETVANSFTFSPVSDDDSTVVIDFDSRGHIVGIEILASGT